MRKGVTLALILVSAVMYSCLTDSDSCKKDDELESCTNSTCRPGIVMYPDMFIDMDYDGESELQISRTGVVVDITSTAMTSSGYAWIIVVPLDSIYFACSEETGSVICFAPGDTIDERYDWKGWDGVDREYVVIAELYMEDAEWDHFWGGVFPGISDGYLGFRLHESGVVYYGWIELYVSEYDATVTVKRHYKLSPTYGTTIAGEYIWGT